MKANARGARTLCGGVAALFMFAVFLFGGMSSTLQPGESATSFPASSSPRHADLDLLQSQSTDKDGAVHRRYRETSDDNAASIEDQGAAEPSGASLQATFPAQVGPAPSSATERPSLAGTRVMRC
ncbi:hypothetical protein ACFVUW_17990 [Streptomyces xiamenensis]|uniref:hypothetical protein n=1 Tax=Streptomyces xiamenensis TaxID=408015 RepID=UPI0036E6A9FE